MRARLFLFINILVLVAAFASASFKPIRADASEQGHSTIVLEYGDQKFAYIDKKMQAADFLTDEDIQKRRINQPLGKKVELVERLIESGADIKDAILYPFPLLYKTVEQAISTIACPAVDAEIRFKPDSQPMFEIKRSQVGLSIAEQSVYEDIYFALSRGLRRVALEVLPVMPSVTAEQYALCTKRRAYFTTSCEGSTEERKHNIALALSRINGTRLDPGEEFSFNKVVGRRTSSNGFLQAKIIVGGKYIDGTGGGVCQASSTLYNCALLSGLTITKVNRHTLVSNYVEPSFDAMVNSGYADLCFKNDGEYPAFIKAELKGDKAQVQIYSTALPYKIERKSVTLYMGERPADEEFIDTAREYTEGMETGTRYRVSGGAPHVRSEGYLIKRHPDGTTETTLIRTDSYSAAVGRIAIAP